MNKQKQSIAPKYTSSPEIEGYAKAVAKLADSESSLVFGNEGYQHAAVVMTNIFQYSKDIVRIYANKFHGAVSNNEEYCDALERFIKRDGRVHVIYQNQPNPDSKGYGILEKYSKKPDTSKNIVIQETTGYIADKISKTLDNRGKYFTTGDNNKFRLEINPDTFEAAVSFNNNKLTQILNEIFDEDFNSKNKA